MEKLGTYSVMEFRAVCKMSNIPATSTGCIALRAKFKRVFAGTGHQAGGGPCGRTAQASAEGGRERDVGLKHGRSVRVSFGVIRDRDVHARRCHSTPPTHRFPNPSRAIPFANFFAAQQPQLAVNRITVDEGRLFLRATE